MKELWDNAYQGIQTANAFIREFEGVSGQETNVAEALVLRAFFYYQLIDFFEGVHIVTESPLPGQLGPRNTRGEVFDFIVNDITTASSDLLTENVTLNYGKIKHWDAQALLAKLYLNAEVYTGTARWNECITTCDAIINSGQYSLASNYFDNFLISNEGSNENMFVIQFSPSDPGPVSNHFQMETLHYNQLDDGLFANPSVGTSPWNGFTTLADFYNSFDPADDRLGDISNGQVHQGFLIGQQLDDLGLPLFERDGATPLIFTLDVPLIDATESEGVRVLKFEADEVSPPGQAENDYPIFRYSDILLMKAEAALRTGDNSTALNLVNSIRARAFDPDQPLTSVSLDQIFDERGFELYWEGTGDRT